MSAKSPALGSGFCASEVVVSSGGSIGSTLGFVSDMSLISLRYWELSQVDQLLVSVINLNIRPRSILFEGIGAPLLFEPGACVLGIPHEFLRLVYITQFLAGA